MTRLARVVTLALLAGLISGTAQAFLFGNKDNEKDKKKQEQSVGPKVQYKYHLHVPSEKTEQELMGLLQSRQLLEEDVKVLRRLEASRTKEYAVFQNMLKKEFGLEPTHYYAFDRETSSLYDVTEGEEDRTLHHQFEDDEKETQFLNYSQKKKSAYEEIAMLRRLLKQQQVQLNNVNNLLSAKFSLNARKGYYYDKASMILYEVVPLRRGN